MVPKQQNIFVRLWTWTNGKKTGFFSFVLVAYLWLVSHSFLSYDQSFVDVINYLVAGSLGHKVVKKVNA